MNVSPGTINTQLAINGSSTLGHNFFCFSALVQSNHAVNGCWNMEGEIKPNWRLQWLKLDFYRFSSKRVWMMNELVIVHAFNCKAAPAALTAHTGSMSGRRLYPIFDKHLWVWKVLLSRHCCVQGEALEKEQETKAELLSGWPQLVSLSRTRRHQTKPITL